MIQKIPQKEADFALKQPQQIRVRHLLNTTGMMRITPVVESAKLLRLTVEGQIAGAASRELGAMCAEQLTKGRTVELGLAGVSFVDDEGAKLLRLLDDRGAILRGCSPFVQEVLADHSNDPESHSAAADEDATLVTRLRTGDPQAFETMVRSYGGKMLATAKRLLDNEHDARDALQDALLAAFKAIDRFAGNSLLSTWLHRIVVNAALMQMRSRRRKAEESIDELLPSFDVHGRWDDGKVQHQLDAELLVGRRDTRAMVRSCIQCLPPRYRAVLVLRDIEELNTAETGKVLGLSLNAVKVRLHRARQALKTLLEREPSLQGRSASHSIAESGDPRKEGEDRSGKQKPPAFEAARSNEQLQARCFTDRPFLED